MVKRWTDRMAGIKYAPKPYDKSVTVLERVEYFRHWFYTTHQKERCSGNETRYRE